MTLWKLEQQNKRIVDMEEKVKGLVSEQLFRRCVVMINKRYEYNFNKIKNTNIKKFDILIKQKINRHTLSSKSKHIYNYTDVQLPTEVEMILNLEPKFGIEIKEKWKVIPTVIKDLEFGIEAVQLDDCNDEGKDIVKNNLRSKAINVISNYYKKNKNKKKK